MKVFYKNNNPVHLNFISFIKNHLEINEKNKDKIEYFLWSKEEEKIYREEMKIKLAPYVEKIISLGDILEKLSIKLLSENGEFMKIFPRFDYENYYRLHQLLAYHKDGYFYSNNIDKLQSELVNYRHNIFAGYSVAQRIKSEYKEPFFNKQIGLKELKEEEALKIKEFAIEYLSGLSVYIDNLEELCSCHHHISQEYHIVVEGIKSDGSYYCHSIYRDMYREAPAINDPRVCNKILFYDYLDTSKVVATWSFETEEETLKVYKILKQKLGQTTEEILIEENK